MLIRPRRRLYLVGADLCPPSNKKQKQKMPPSFLEFCLNAAFVVTAGVHVWQQLRRAQEMFERTSGGGGNGSGPRRVVLTTPQGERILVLASDEALREMGLLAGEEAEEAGEGEEGASEGRAGAAARHGVLLRVPGGLGGGGLRGGEFGPDDYEALSSLDEGLRPARRAPVSQELLDTLPTHVHHCRRKATTTASSSSSSSPAPEEEGGGGGSSSSSSFETCSVCLQDFEEGETVRTLPCLHHFHLACVDPWLKQRGRSLAACPVCKTTVFA